jgi:hypothetical protein
MIALGFLDSDKLPIRRGCRRVNLQEAELPNLFTRILLFLSSYAPLFVILGIRNSFGNRTVSITLFAVAAVSVLVLVGYLAIVKRLGDHSVVVQQTSAKDGEAMSYVVTYLLPFLGLDSTNRADQISLAVFLLVVAVLYVSSNLIHMNPMLNLLRYRILELDSDDGKRSILLTKRSYIRPGTRINAVSLDDLILLEKT